MRTVQHFSPAEALYTTAEERPEAYHGMVVERVRAGEVLSLPAAVWRQLGLGGREPDDRTAAMGRRALAEYLELARPVGVQEEIRTEDFAAVFAGEGQNEPDAPLAGVFPRAERLALFAATLGPEVSRRIAELFAAQDFALGAVLDAVASMAADGMTAVLEQRLAARLAEAAPRGPAPAVLAYSPGYCGWHVSGQRRLFARLRPEEAGVTLRPSCLMEPLKSVSGVLVAGAPAIHRFDDRFGFCAACATHACRARHSHRGD